MAKTTPPVVVDTTPPVVSISSAGGLVRKAPQTVTGLGEAGTPLALYDGAMLLGTTTVAANGKWSLAVTLGGEGTHRLVARDTDATGNAGFSAPLGFTLDTLAPLVGMRGTGGLTRSPAQRLGGSGEAGTQVQLWDNGALLGGALVGADGQWSLAVTLAGEGAHRLVAKDTDDAGNVGASSALVFTLDTLAPAVTLAGAGGLTRLPGQVFSGTTEAGAQVQLWDGAVLLGQQVASAGGQWSLSVTLAGEGGAHALFAAATDAAGNVGTSAGLALTLDTVAPLVEVTTPARVVLKPTQTIAGTGEAGTTVTLFDNAGSLGTALVDATGHWSVAVTLAGAGTHLLVAKDLDAAGNVGASAVIGLTLALPNAGLLVVPAPAKLVDADFAGLAGLAALYLSGSGAAALALGAQAALAFGNRPSVQAGAGVTGLVLDAAALGRLAPLSAVGSAGADSMVGGAGDDWFRGVGGADSIWGGGGNDTFDYTLPAEFLANAQRIDGGTGSNQLSFGFTGAVIDSAFAAVRHVQNIWLYGDGAVSLTLGHQASLAFGAKVVVGSAAGVDRLVVDGGKLDAWTSLVAQGGGGDDSFIGGSSDDVLTGGGGNDVFDLSLGGHDIVTDFDAAHDVLKLYGLGVVRFADLGTRLSYAGGNAFVVLDATHQVVLGNVAPGSLGPANFHFTQADPVAAPVLNVNLLLRGQSNAFLFDSFGGLEALRHKLEGLLGFDGRTSTVTLVADAATPNGANTINSGTALLTDWLKPVGGDWHQGWQVNTLEQGLLNDIAAMPAAVKASPTAVVWLHNEYDSTVPGLTAAQWTSAVRFDAGLVRQALGQGAGSTPYLFVNAIPFQGADADSNQQIRLGMQALAQDAAFNATVGAQFLDADMNGFGAAGGQHMGTADALLLGNRLASSLAESLAAYALPGSAAALGRLDAAGPQVVKAEAVAGHDDQVLLTVAFDHGSSLKPLDAVAASGADWFANTGVALAGGQWATAAQLLDASHLRLTFANALPANALVFYGYGYGRVVAPDGTGNGHGIYDDQGMPLWTAAAGVQLGAPAQSPLADLPWH